MSDESRVTIKVSRDGGEGAREGEDNGNHDNAITGVTERRHALTETVLVVKTTERASRPYLVKLRISSALARLSDDVKSRRYLKYRTRHSENGEVKVLNSSSGTAARHRSDKAASLSLGYCELSSPWSWTYGCCRSAGRLSTSR